MKKILIFTIVLFCLFNCETTQKTIKINSVESTEQVALFYSKKMKTIWSISLPYYVEITNDGFFKKKFRNYIYHYGNQQKGKAIELYLVDNNEFFEQSFSEEKHIKSKETNKYLIKSKHFVDTTKFNKLYFKPYIERMQAENKDTLHIGTVTEFKQKHKELFENLTKNDSISFLFLNKSGFKAKTKAVEY